MKNAILQPVSPVEPAAPYVGGKRLLAKTIIRKLIEIPHKTYAEPFIGMGGIFLRRPVRSQAEVINDISKDVTTLFRVLQRHHRAFMEMLKWQLSSRDEFERLRAIPSERLTDLERAARFLYVQRQGFGGQVAGKVPFGVNKKNGSAFNVTTLSERLYKLHERLAKVTIECLPYDEFIRRYDFEDALFYLDPPYYKCEHYYGNCFQREDFKMMAEQLGTIEGKFILSLNDVPEVREIFKGFHIESVLTKYSLSKGGSKETNEVLISNVNIL